MSEITVGSVYVNTTGSRFRSVVGIAEGVVTYTGWRKLKDGTYVPDSRKAARRACLLDTFEDWAEGLASATTTAAIPFKPLKSNKVSKRVPPPAPPAPPAEDDEIAPIDLDFAAPAVPAVPAAPAPSAIPALIGDNTDDAEPAPLEVGKIYKSASGGTERKIVELRHFKVVFEDIPLSQHGAGHLDHTSFRRWAGLL